MAKKKYYLILSAAIIVIGGLVFWAASRPKKAEAPVVPTDEIIYYYGKDCPHCHDVDQFLKDNQIDQKVKFIRKEVQYNPGNAQELFSRDNECAISGSDAGAFPLVYSQGKCFLGTPDVINFFKNKAGIQNLPENN
jgi:glutaredoxin